MSLHLVTELDYNGMDGVHQIRNLQHDLEAALECEDWGKVRRLDQACAMLIDKVITANEDDCHALVLALNELKSVYAALVMRCHNKVAAMAG